jgi:hypothetical protein
MAIDKPKADACVVPLDGLSTEQRLILRHQIEVWRDRDREDLQEPDKLEEPDRVLRRVASYERLIDALKERKIALPDEEARSVLKSATDAFAEERESGENNAIHDAQLALLTILQGCGEEEADQCENASAGGWTTRDDDLATESAVLQRVIDVHPARLTEAELIRELIGEHAEFGDQDAVERAVRDLAGVGLIHTAEEFVTPTRAALRFEELIER